MITINSPKEIWLQLGFGDEGTHTWCDHETEWQPQVKYTRCAALSGEPGIITLPVEKSVGAVPTCEDGKLGSLESADDLAKLDEAIDFWENADDIDVEENLHLINSIMDTFLQAAKAHRATQGSKT